MIYSYNNQHNAPIRYFILWFCLTCFGLSYSPSSRDYVWNMANDGCLLECRYLWAILAHRYRPPGAHITCCLMDNGNWCIEEKQAMCESDHALFSGAILSLPHMPSRHVHWQVYWSQATNFGNSVGFFCGGISQSCEICRKWIEQCIYIRYKYAGCRRSCYRVCPVWPTARRISHWILSHVCKPLIIT
jgi:hypothetical protein